MYTEFSDDGCPNNCAYCKKYGYECIYEHKENGEISYNHNSSLINAPFTCAKCHKQLMSAETYSYKGFDFCKECFDNAKSEVESLIQKANKSAAHRHFEVADPQLISFKKQKEITNGALEIAANESIYDENLRAGIL